jgi:hypothetical protein
MQFRVLAAGIIFLASYLPLSVILLFQDLSFDRPVDPLCNPVAAGPQCTLPLDHPLQAIGAVLGCAVALGVTILLLALVQPKRKIVIKESKHVPADLMNYVLPYIVALMGLDYKDIGKLLGFLIFFLWIFTITYRSGQVILNPVLTVFGWQLYDVSYAFEGGPETYNGAALSRVVLHAGSKYDHVAIQDVLIVKGVTR